jgi:hypothetical protein
VASGSGAVIGDGAFTATSVVGSSAATSIVGAGAAFTVGVFERTAFGPAPFRIAGAGEGAVPWPISVSAKLLDACCEARSRLDDDASCKSRLRSSFIALFGDALFFAQPARTTAEMPTAIADDLRTLNTCPSRASAPST